jgi:outer membrane protein insertion porin family
VVALAAFAILHMPWGRSVASRALERWASRATGGTVRLGELELALWRGEAAATAVYLRLPDVSVDVPRATVDWSPARGLRVALLRPAIMVRASRTPGPAGPKGGLAVRPWQMLERLEGAEVVDGRLEIRDAHGAPWLALGPFAVDATHRGGHATLHIQRGDVGWPDGGLRVRSVAAEAELRLEAGVLVIDRARLTAGASTIDLQGRLERIEPITASASAQAALDGALVEALAPGSALTGRIGVKAAVQVVDDRLRGTLEAASPALSIAHCGPWSASGRGRFEGSTLVLDVFGAAGFGGRIEASGPLALTSSVRTRLSLEATDIDPSALARVCTDAKLPISARAGARMTWTAQGWDFESSRGKGRVTVSAGTGRGLRPAGMAAVSTHGREVAIDQGRLDARGARATARAKIGSGGALAGAWTLDLPLSAAPALAADLGSWTTLPEVSGNLRLEGTVGGSLSEPRGTAAVRGEGLSLGGEPLGLDGSLGVQAGEVRLDPLVLRSGSGQATLTGAVPLAAARAWDLTGTIEGLGTRPFQKLLGLSGSGAATGTLRVSGPRDEPRGETALRAAVELPRPDDTSVSDAVTVEIDAASEGRRVHVERVAAEVAGGRISGEARYDLSSHALTAGLESTGLAWNRLPLLPTSARRMSGTVAGRVALSGRADAPAGHAQLTLAGAAIDGAALPALSMSARSDGHDLRVEGAAEEVFLRGRGTLAGDWPLALELDLAHLPWQALAEAIAPASARPVSLAASGTLEATLPLRAPSRLTYAGASLSAWGRVRQTEWRLAPLALRGDGESVSVEGFEVSAGKASLVASGRVGLTPTSPFDLEVAGDVDFAELDPGPGRRSFAGTARLRLAVAGTRDAPQLSGTLALTGVRGRIEEAPLRDLSLDARFVGRDLEVERLTADLLGGTITAQGRLPIVRRDRTERARFTFALADLDLARALRREGREEASAPSLLLSLEGEMEASALEVESITARGRVTRLEPRPVDGSLALAEPAPFTLESRRFRLPTLRLAGTLGDLEASAEADLDASRPRATASLAGALDLGALGAFLPGTTLGGRAQVDARLQRVDAAWRLHGGVRVEHARLSLDTLNFALSDLTGALRFEGERGSLDATGVAGEGRLRAKGGFRMGPALLQSADVTIEGERMPVQYPPGYRSRARGSLRFTGEPGRFRLGGDLSMSQGYYTAEIDARSQSLDRLDWQLAALEGGGLTEQVALDLNLRLEDPLRVRNSTVQVDVEGAVAVSGTLAQPTAGGQVTLREGGELTVGRGRVRVQRGTVELNGYPAGTPRVDFDGATRVSGVLLEVRARGPLDDLQLTLQSDRSDLSQTDLVTLLLTGRTASEAASQSGAVVAEQLAVALGGMLQKGVGSTLMIDVSPDRSLLSDDTDPTQRFHIGTRVTQNLMVVYSAALDGTEKQWVVEFNPGGGRFRLRAISEEDNSFSLEASDRLTFNLWSRGRGRAPREVDRLTAIHLEGAPEPLAGELRKALELKTGRRYSGLQREQAADRMRERLARAGHRSGSVDAVTERTSGGVSLRVRIEPGPLVPIQWTGDDAGAKVRAAAEAAWPPFATPEVAAAQVARAALVRLQAEGHYTATVEPEVAAAPDRVEVRMRVTRGPRGSGVDVLFEGNRALGQEALAAGLPKAGGRAFFEALDPRSARIANEVRLAYARVGYLRARVGAPRTAFDAASGRLRVTIPVHERGASLVSRIELPPEAAQASDLALRLKPAQPFDVTAYVDDRDALSAWYRANGWVAAQVRGVLEPGGSSVSVRYLADAGPRPRVADIRVDEPGRTRDVLVRRSISVKPGDFVRPSALADSRERLTDIGVFRSVDVRAEPRADDPERRDVVVDLVDKPDLQVEYGLRYTTAGEGSAGGAPSSPSQARLQAAGAIELVNPLGFGVKARAYGFGTTDRQTWGANLDAATLAGWRLRTQLFVFDDHDSDTEISGVASRVRGVTAQQTRVLLRDRRGRRRHDRLRLQWGYTFKDIEYVESAEAGRVLQGDRGFASLALIGDERDNITDPRRGIFWTGTTELARTGLGSDVDYERYYGQLFAYLPLGPLVWAQGYRLGMVPGTDPLLLLENRFRAGGPTTVRGFDQNELGPRTSAGDSLGGQAVAVFNQELRFPIVGKLKGGIFWDAGNVWPTSGELDLGDLRQSAGAGLRYVFPFGPVRIEYAWILKRREGEPAGRFVFGLGHAF